MASKCTKEGKQGDLLPSKSQHLPQQPGDLSPISRVHKTTLEGKNQLPEVVP